MIYLTSPTIFVLRYSSGSTSTTLESGYDTTTGSSTLHDRMLIHDTILDFCTVRTSNTLHATVRTPPETRDSWSDREM